MAENKQLTKLCTGTCGRVLPLESYGLHSSGRFGRQPQCRDCVREKNNRIRLSDPHRAQQQVLKSKRKKPEKYRAIARKYASKHNRDHMLKYSYGITSEDYQKMLVSQGGKCRICAREPNPGKHLHVDHNHTTQKIRALLCGNCNRGLGIFKDDRYLLQRAIEYLSEF